VASDTRPAVERVYRVFKPYSFAGAVFCGLCYTAEEIDYITNTPVADIDADHGRTLLWETADHWENADVYRHYLPRLLELVGPPWFLDDIYPRHLFETLIALGFRQWPEAERKAVIDYLITVGPELFNRLDNADRSDWAAGVAALKNPALSLPTGSQNESPSD
jgi:hypothetical protein